MSSLAFDELLRSVTVTGAPHFGGSTTLEVSMTKKKTKHVSHVLCDESNKMFVVSTAIPAGSSDVQHLGNEIQNPGPGAQFANSSGTSMKERNMSNR